MPLVKVLAVALGLTASAASVTAQMPISSAIRAQLQHVAGSYRLDSAYALGKDTAVLVFRDSTLTKPAVDAGTWMFGPATTKAEDDGCPPEKVLGRRLARTLWRALGKPKLVQMVVVRIHGPLVEDPLGNLDELTTDLFYPRDQLTGPWVGDRRGLTSVRADERIRLR